MPSEADRGLGATLIGGGGGAYLGKKLGGGSPLGAIGGSVVGALAANMLEGDKYV